MKQKEKVIELHRMFTSRWMAWGKTAWETIKTNILLSSALTSLTAYSIIYVYTSEFFWEIPLLVRIAVRIGLTIVPIILFCTNRTFQNNFHRQCKRMYELAPIVFKIQDEMGLYAERPANRENFPNDEWYVPDEWKNLAFQKSKDYVNASMNSKDRFYKDMLPLFQLFRRIAIALIVVEIALLVLHP